MTAILTKYIPATNKKPTRIKAYLGNGGESIILAQSKCEDEAEKMERLPFEYQVEKTHRFAAQALQKKMNWNGTLRGGGTKEGYAFVFVD